MGNKSDKITSVDFNHKDWQEVEQQSDQNNESKGNYRILVNSRSEQLIDQYEMFWPSQQQFVFYLDSYNWRKNEYHIVQSKYIVEQHNEQFCSRSYSAKVYIEHIDTRLSDIKDIPYPDNLYLTLSALQGYQKLYENLHYFPLSEDQICIDKDGIVKVWVNSDLSKNYPQQIGNNTGQIGNKDQNHMVEQLMSMIWNNTDEQNEPASFQQFYRKKQGKKRFGFDEAKVIVNEYAKMTGSQIPQQFVSILQMRQQSDQGKFDNEDQSPNNNQGQQIYDQIPDSYNEQQYSGNFGPNAQRSTGQHFISPQSHQFVPGGYQNSNHVRNLQSGFGTPNISAYPQNIFQNFMPKPLGVHTGPIISIPPMHGGHFLPGKVNRTVISPSQSPQVHYTQQTNSSPVHLIQNLTDAHRQQYEINQKKENNHQQNYENHGSSRFNNLMVNENHYPQYSEQSRSAVHSYNLIGGQQVHPPLEQPPHKSLINQAVNPAILSHYQRSGHENSRDTYLSNTNTNIYNYEINSIRSIDGRESQQYRQSHEQYDRQNHESFALDSEQIKYYTIDNEIELDQQIAADLKRFIAAV